MSEAASERMSAAERASEASSAERANERTEERMAQCSTRRFHSHSTHRVERFNVKNQKRDQESRNALLHKEMEIIAR